MRPVPAKRLIPAAAVVFAVAALAQPRDPIPVDLVEETTTQLVQVDVTVSGPADRIADLDADDFKVRLGFKKLLDFEVDRLCESPAPAAPGDGGRPVAPPAARSRTSPPTSYLFYFDQTQLTIAGRNRALSVARELVPKLVAGGDRAMIVSNAASLATIQGFSDDPSVLLQALERLEHDRSQIDYYSSQEDERLNEVVRALNDTEFVNVAVARARAFQQEERQRTDRALRRLHSTVGRLALVDQPKAVIYFSDHLRSNAGEHYLGFFGVDQLSGNAAISKMRADSTSAVLPYDKVVTEAAAQGVRFYTVEAEGIDIDFGLEQPSLSGTRRSRTNKYSLRARSEDAARTLGSLATETGGRAFLNGVEADTVAAGIREDFSCLYLISFRPEGYSLDSPHRIVIEPRDPEIRFRHRGRFVVQSETERVTSRMLAAMTAPGEDAQPFELKGFVVPTGFDGRRYTALLQVRLLGLPLPDTEWDVGASFVMDEKVLAETSSRFTHRTAGVPSILESEVEFKPGEFRLVSVARESRTDLVVSGETGGRWPAPGRGPALGPLALMQPVSGAFLRDGVSRSSGSLARDPGEAVDPALATALVGLVCRGRGRSTLTVERELRGESVVRFDPVRLDGDERCTQLRDVIPAGTMGPGEYRYHVRLLDGADLLAETSRGFFAFTPSQTERP